MGRNGVHQFDGEKAMINYYDNIGAIGIVKDMPSHECPQEAWTDGVNIDFHDNKAIKSSGYQEQFESSTASPSIAIAPYHLLFHKVGNNDYWAYAGVSEVYATDGTTHANITNTSASYTSVVATIPWTGGNLGGIAIFNNGVQTPQQWGDTVSAASLTKTLKDLENWSATTTARFVRPFKEFLIAGDITKDGVRNERELRWSHPAEPGTVPDSWDYNDTTKDAGKVELSKTSDRLMDSLPLRDVNVVYKEYSCWGMQYIGNPNIFRIYNIFENIGMLAPRCAAYFFGRHFVFGTDDIIIHDGQNHETPLNKKLTRTIFNNIDPSNYKNSFIIPNYRENEIWFCYPENGNTWANIALVWNFKDNTSSFRELPGVTHAALGVGGVGSDTWASDSGVYSLDSSTGDQKTYNPTVRRLLMASPGSTDRIYVMDETEQKAGVNMTSYLEREALPLGRQTPDGRILVDHTSYKFVRNVYPKITGTNGGTVNIYLGTQPVVGGTKTWTDPLPFVIGTDYKVDCRVNGRIISIKFESTSNIAWEMSGFAIDFDIEGTR